MLNCHCIAAIYFASILICCAPADAALIGIDNRHGSSSAFFMGSGANYATFRATITGAGNTIVPLNTFNTADLAGLNAVFSRQSQSSAANFSGSEITALQNFVTAGHGLVICAESTGDASTVTNINSLAAPYGVTYSSTTSDFNGFTITGFVSHSVTAGLSSIGVDSQRVLNSIVSPAVDLTLGSGSNDALAAVQGTGGKGNTVLVSDTSWWSNSVPNDRPITFGDNAQLLKNVVSYVVPEPTTGLLAMAGALLLMRRLTHSQFSAFASARAEARR